MIKKESRNVSRLKRHERIRKTVSGTSSVPRLNIFRSNTNIYAQIIDDESGKTLVSASSLDMKLKGNNKSVAEKVGSEIGTRALKAGITEVVFDRGGYKYHGRVLALAEKAREAGLKF